MGWYASSRHANFHEPRRLAGLCLSFFLFSRPMPEPESASFHMTPEAFRQHGHALIDWIADYY